MRSRVRGADRSARLPRRRWPWTLGWTLLLVGALTLATAGWVAVTGLKARSNLQYIADQASTLRDQMATGNYTAAIATAQDLAARANRAHDLTSGPAWWTASKVPSLGDPVISLRGIASAADQLATNVLPQAVDALRVLDSKRAVDSTGTVDVGIISNLAASVSVLQRQGNAVSADVQELPAHTWLPAVDAARTKVAGAVGQLLSAIGPIAVGLQVSPALLGAGGLKRYFVGFLNSAELRGVGGLPGAFAIVEVNHGRVTFTHFGSDQELEGASAAVQFGPQYAAQYGDWEPSTQFLNSTVSPHFPYAAQIWASMWQRRSGQHVDGAIAADPTALAYLLGASGPTRLADGTVVSADTVVSLTQSTAYARFGDDQVARKKFLLDVAAAAEQKIFILHGNPLALLKAAARAVSERRLLVWSADPTTQRAIESTGVGGAVPITDAPYGFAVVDNSNASKLDYYLHESVQWTRTGCGATRQVTVRISLTNTAPRTGLTRYVTSTSDGSAASALNTLVVDYFATTGAVATGVTLNGVTVPTTVGSERGHPVYRKGVAIPSGSTQVLVLTLLEPAGSTPPRIDRQPLVNPVQLTVTDQPCS